MLQRLVMSLVLLLHYPQLYIFIIQLPILFPQVHALNCFHMRSVSSLLYRFIVKLIVFERGVKLDLSHLLILYCKIIIL